MYSKDEIGDGKFSELVGTAIMKKFNKSASEKLTKWLDRFNESEEENVNEMAVFMSDELHHVAEQMNTHVRHSGFLTNLFNNSIFQNWILINTMNEQRMKWFEALHGCQSIAFDSMCTYLLNKLFGMLEETMKNSSESFEALLRKYLLGEEFRELYEVKFVKLGLEANRQCAIFLVDVTKVEFEEAFIKMLSSNVKKARNNDPIDTSSS